MIRPVHCNGSRVMIDGNVDTPSCGNLNASAGTATSSKIVYD
jgi:hypothetical protein